MGSRTHSDGIMSDSLTLRSARAIKRRWTHGVHGVGRNVGKVVVTCVSTCAAVVSIVAFARTYGLTGGPEKAHLAVGGFAAVWVGVAPAADTAYAIGDTIQLVATAKDSHGGTLARARISVRPRAVAVRFRAGGAADQGLARVGEGTRVRLEAFGVDARGHTLAGRVPSWHSADTGVVTVDSAGFATGVAPGSGTVVATVDGVSERLPVDVTPVPASLALLSGGEQRAAAGSRLAQPLVVRVMSTRGQPVVAVSLNLTTADGGTPEPAVAVTDADGRARARWTLGDTPGRQRITAAVESLDSVAAAFAEADPVAANVRAEAIGANQAAPAGAALPLPVGVRLTDSLGRALAGVPVTWTSAEGGGTVTAEAVRTDSAGEARARWRLGAHAGSQRLRALVGGARSAVPTVSVFARALAGAPTVVAVTAGDAQRAPAGAALVWPVVLRVLDRAGNPVAGASVALAPSAGSVADSTAETDSLGIARVWWTLGRAAGPQKLTARVRGIASPVVVTAVARPRAAANLELAGAPDSAAAGRALAKPVTITVTDAYGNPVADARVRFTADAGGSATARTLMTDERGRATTRWTLGRSTAEQSPAAEVNAEARGTVRVHAVAAAAPKAVAATTRPRATVASKQPASKLVAPKQAASKSAPKSAASKPATSKQASSSRPAAKPAAKSAARSASRPTTTVRERTASRG